MTDLILLLQAEHDIQTAFERYEDYQQGRGEIFMRQLDAALAFNAPASRTGTILRRLVSPDAHSRLSVWDFL
jgi:hypothetical protein